MWVADVYTFAYIVYVGACLKLSAMQSCSASNLAHLTPTLSKCGLAGELADCAVRAAAFHGAARVDRDLHHFPVAGCNLHIL
jgi:hypothetical protein